MISLFPFCCGERGSKLRLPALRRRFLAREEGPSPSHLNKRGGGGWVFGCWLEWVWLLGFFSGFGRERSISSSKYDIRFYPESPCAAEPVPLRAPGHREAAAAEWAAGLAGRQSDDLFLPPAQPVS